MVFLSTPITAICKEQHRHQAVFNQDSSIGACPSFFMALWLYGFMALWLYGFMALWLYGFMALWLYGFMALWLYESVGVLVFSMFSKNAICKEQHRHQAVFNQPLSIGACPSVYQAVFYQDSSIGACPSFALYESVGVLVFFRRCSIKIHQSVRVLVSLFMNRWVSWCFAGHGGRRLARLTQLTNRFAFKLGCITYTLIH
jgi:hypothetical protein